MKYEKNPEEVDAIIWDGTNKDEIAAFCQGHAIFRRGGHLNLTSVAGTVVANKGDYIVKDFRGGFYPYKPEAFKGTHKEKKT